MMRVTGLKQSVSNRPNNRRIRKFGTYSKNDNTETQNFEDMCTTLVALLDRMIIIHFSSFTLQR